MTGEEANKAARMKRLLLKLAELAEILDDITHKMKTLADKQKKFAEKKKKNTTQTNNVLPSPENPGQEKQNGNPPFLQFPVDNFQVFMVKKDPPSAKKPALPPKKKQKPKSGKMTLKEYIEFKTFNEYLRFKKMDPISPQELKDIDLDDLSRQISAL